jgi:hypothetical protein
VKEKDNSEDLKVDTRVISELQTSGYFQKSVIPFGLNFNILLRVGWYTPLIRRVLIRMIGFISS